jgi:hypothetical protein
MYFPFQATKEYGNAVVGKSPIRHILIVKEKSEAVKTKNI